MPLTNSRKTVISKAVYLVEEKMAGKTGDFPCKTARKPVSKPVSIE